MLLGNATRKPSCTTSSSIPSREWLRSSGHGGRGRLSHQDSHREAHHTARGRRPSESVRAAGIEEDEPAHSGARPALPIVFSSSTPRPSRQRWTKIIADQVEGIIMVARYRYTRVRLQNALETLPKNKTRDGLERDRRLPAKSTNTKITTTTSTTEGRYRPLMGKDSRQAFIPGTHSRLSDDPGDAGLL